MPADDQEWDGKFALELFFVDLHVDGAAAIDSLRLLLMKPVPILLCLLSIVSWCVSAPAQAGTLKSDGFARSTAMILVTTSEWNTVEGRFEAI